MSFNVPLMSQCHLNLTSFLLYNATLILIQLGCCLAPQVLQVTPEASLAEIKKVYRKVRSSVLCCYLAMYVCHLQSLPMATDDNAYDMGICLLQHVASSLVLS